MNKSKNVFISHHGKDDEHIKKLKDLLFSKGYTIKNSSVDSTRPNKIRNDEVLRRLLRLRINWAGTFICLIGDETYKRPWVDWEIKKAHEKGKRILGVHLFGTKDNAVIPKSLERYGSGLTGWNGDKVIDFLEGKDIGWCNNRGERAPVTSLSRANCR